MARYVADQLTTLDVTYTAVGKGLLELAAAPAGLLENYKVSLIANGSDVRLLELSLQPTSQERSGSTRWPMPPIHFGLY